MPRFVGQISLLPFTFEPAGSVFCDGRLLPISENDTLFSRIGNTFGGDGESTFAVPDLRSIAPNNCQYVISLFGYYEPESSWLIVGQTMISAFSINKGGVLQCAGQSLSTSQYRVLELYMGNRFGGDGTNNFNLPDLRGKAPAHCSYMMAGQGLDPSSTERAELFVGELLLLPYEIPEPRGLRLCNGDMLSIAQNTALYSLLGDRFGGGGQNFALPNLGAAAPSKFNYYIAVQGVLPQRS